ncbi:unnamed protein product [Effrenium voratum]|nr:unnamed protein product [Effrenium voratum]
MERAACCELPSAGPLHRLWPMAKVNLSLASRRFRLESRPGAQAIAGVLCCLMSECRPFFQGEKETRQLTVFPASKFCGLVCFGEKLCEVVLRTPARFCESGSVPA